MTRQSDAAAPHRLSAAHRIFHLEISGVFKTQARFASIEHAKDLAVGERCVGLNTEKVAEIEQAITCK